MELSDTVTNSVSDNTEFQQWDTPVVIVSENSFNLIVAANLCNMITQNTIRIIGSKQISSVDFWTQCYFARKHQTELFTSTDIF